MPVPDSLNDCPFRIGDKVKIISPLLKKEWENSPAFIVGINLKGDNFDRYDFTLREIGSRGGTDGWGIHDIKCIERQHQTEDDCQYPYVKIGKYIVAAYPEYIWIGLDGDGEGGGFDEAKLEAVIEKFYGENF